MKNVVAIISFLLLAISCSDNNVELTNKKLNIEINNNVELLGFVYFLGFEGPISDSQTLEINGRQILHKDWHSYGFNFYQKYESFGGSENLASAFGVADHLWLDYLINLLIQVEEFPNARLLQTIDEDYYLNFSKSGDANEAKKNVSIFLEGLNQFYEEVGFESYLSESQAYYDNALAQVRDNLPEIGLLDMMEKFYRKEFDRYTLIPSLTIPKGMGFGDKYTSNGLVNIYNVFGAFDFQHFEDSLKLDLGFNNKRRLLELSIHEFGHSFVNPVIDQITDEEIILTEKLFDPIKSEMSAQGYNTWKSCLYEHFVRAREVIVTKNLGNIEDAKNLQTHYVEDRKFIYIPIIIKELEEFDSNQQMSYLDVVTIAMEELITVVNKIPTTN